MKIGTKVSYKGKQGTVEILVPEGTSVFVKFPNEARTQRISITQLEVVAEEPEPAEVFFLKLAVIIVRRHREAKQFIKSQSEAIDKTWEYIFHSKNRNALLSNLTIEDLEWELMGLI